LLSWAQDWDTPVTIDATTLTNVLDLSSTSVTANTPGFSVQLTHHARSGGGGEVPVRFAVRAVRTAGTGTLTVRLTDGTDYVELTGIATGGIDGWYVVSGFLPADLGKYDLQALVSDGSTEFELGAVSLFEWEQ
jgi:hypothetical protein